MPNIRTKDMQAMLSGNFLNLALAAYFIMMSDDFGFIFVLISWAACWVEAIMGEDTGGPPAVTAIRAALWIVCVLSTLSAIIVAVTSFNI